MATLIMDAPLISGGTLRALLMCAGIALLVFLPLGRALCRRMLGAAGARAVAIPVALGSGAWGLLVLVLGSAGLLDRFWLVLSAVAACLAGWRLSRRTPVPAANAGGNGAGRLVWPLWAVTAAFAMLVLASALAPELSFDALNVHLPYARDAAAAGRLAFHANNWSSAMPALPLMAYATAFVFSGVAQAKLLNAVAWLLCGGVTFAFVRRWYGSLAGAASAALVLCSPVALYEATTAMIDLPLALYCAIAVFAVLEWTASGERGWLHLSSVSLGLALGCKYHAAFWLLPLSLIVLWQTLRQRGGSLRGAVRTLAVYWLVAAVLALPWLVRAWLFTGNPVFPLANGIFRSSYWTPAMEQAARAAYENEGVGRAWDALLALPWTITFHPGPFRGTPGWLLPLGVLLALVRRPDPRVRYGLLASIIFFYSWAFTAQEVRYLLPLVPVLAMLTAFGLLGSAERSDAPTGRRRLLGFAGVAVVLLFCVSSWPGLYHLIYPEWTYWHSWRLPFRYLFGRETAEDFLIRDVPSIRVYDYANEHLGPSDRILLLNDAAQFYSRVPTLYSFTVEGERVLLEESEAGVLRRLRESRVSHVLLNYNGIVPLPRVAPRRGVYFFLDKSFQERHLETVHSDNNVVLYRVRS